MVTSRRGLGDWVEPLSTEVPQIPAQPALDSRAPFTPLRAPVHAQGELGSEVVRVFGEGGVRRRKELKGDDEAHAQSALYIGSRPSSAQNPARLPAHLRQKPVASLWPSRPYALCASPFRPHLLLLLLHSIPVTLPPVPLTLTHSSFSTFALTFPLPGALFLPTATSFPPSSL